MKQLNKCTLVGATGVLIMHFTKLLDSLFDSSQKFFMWKGVVEVLHAHEQGQIVKDHLLQGQIHVQGILWYFLALSVGVKDFYYSLPLQKFLAAAEELG
ncbi:hypothetical protein MTO96_029366 [Rhipicephalus appendiculatus]